MSKSRLVLLVAYVVGVLLAGFQAGCSGAFPCPPDVWAQPINPATEVVTKAFQECSTGQGGAAIVVVRSTQGRVTWPYGPPPVAYSACITARISDARLPDGEYYVEVRWEDAPSDQETFPYPIPKASGATKVRSIENATPGRVADALESALDKAGYAGLMWYRFLDGYALVTPPEKINEDGTPRCSQVPGCERFSNDFTKDFQVREAALGWLWRQELRYRLFAFVVATGDIRYESEAREMERVVPDGGGTAALPDWINALDRNRPYRVHALAYVYSRKEAGQPATLIKNQSVPKHLRAAGLGSLL